MFCAKLLSDNASLPKRGSEGAAGYDLASAEDVVVKAWSKALVKTDVAISIPDNCYAQIAARSSLAWDHSIVVGAGIVDRDYRGNIGVVMFNFSDKDFEVKVGDRIAQLILINISTPEIKKVDSLDESERGDNGFGSTGLR